MPELKFNGPATLVGFPADKSFSFDIEPNRLVVKAGKEVFAIIEREADKVAQFPDGTVPTSETRHLGGGLEGLQRAAPQYTGYDTVKVPAGEVLSPAKFTQDEAIAMSQVEPPKGKSYEGTLTSLILLDPSVKTKYRTIRAKYYETLQTANGREVGWWANSAMVKALEGDPMKMLQFFIDEGVVRIDKRSEGIAAAAVNPISAGLVNPAFSVPGGNVLQGLQGGGQLAAQAQQAPGGWTPPANFGKFA